MEMDENIIDINLASDSKKQYRQKNERTQSNGMQRTSDGHFQKLADSFKIDSFNEEFQSPNDTYDEFIG